MLVHFATYAYIFYTYLIENKNSWLRKKQHLFLLIILTIKPKFIGY